MARPALSTKILTFTLLTAPASLALAALPGVASAQAGAHTVAGVMRPGAAVRACSLKADHIRKGQQEQAMATGLRPRKTAQLWVEGAKVAQPQRIGKNGHVQMSFRVSQPPGRHPVWITDGANRCDVPGGMTVKK
ncbi:MAG TPA: hypothetical protein VGP70_10945 [Actinomadura sp.]|jgi:hypothetical protein|nr:hypothetical protein [Actinomadura sp.]